MNKKLSLRHCFGAAFLVTGTSVGAGMLALPVVTGKSGFIPSIIVYICAWMVMTATGLLYLEICIRMPKNSNIISMAKHFLGNKGKIFAWIFYIFLFYCLSIAYVASGGDFIKALSGDMFSHTASVVIFVIVFASVVYMGAKMVDRVNLILILGLTLSYLFFVVLGAEHIKTNLLAVVNWKDAIFILPVIIVSFGYQGIIPSLTTYLQKDVRKLKLSIIIGTTFTLVIYLVWELLILGIVPLHGVNGLVAAQNTGQSAIQPLRNIVNIKSIYTIGQFFSFFAITTSFLGVTLGLFDFLSDGLKLPKKGRKKILLAFITFVPPAFIAIVNPGIFLIALSYAGSVGGTLLLVFLPAMLVWVARYKMREKPDMWQMIGGKAVLIIVFAFAAYVIFAEIAQEIMRIFY
jgi:tyrosine-specific transport protein